MILFAVIHTSPQYKNRQTYLNPTNFTVEMGDIGFMIANSEAVIEDIAKLKLFNFDPKDIVLTTMEDEMSDNNNNNNTPEESPQTTDSAPSDFMTKGFK